MAFERHAPLNYLPGKIMTAERLGITAVYRRPVPCADAADDHRRHIRASLYSPSLIIYLAYSSHLHS